MDDDFFVGGVDDADLFEGLSGVDLFAVHGGGGVEVVPIANQLGVILGWLVVGGEVVGVVALRDESAAVVVDHHVGGLVGALAEVAGLVPIPPLVAQTCRGDPIDGQLLVLHHGRLVTVLLGPQAFPVLFRIAPLVVLAGPVVEELLLLGLHWLPDGVRVEQLEALD